MVLDKAEKRRFYGFLLCAITMPIWLVSLTYYLTSDITGIKRIIIIFGITAIKYICLMTSFLMIVPNIDNEPILLNTSSI